MQKIVCGYTRYSTALQTENSTAYQKEKIENLCATRDYKLTTWYHDEEKSGTNTEGRPAFLQMVADAGAGKFEAVVVYDITRGSRDVEDWFGFRKAMRRLNVEVISVEDNLGDIYDPSAFLQELITVGIGQHAVLTTRIKSRDGVAVKARQGLFLGGTPPLGYDVIDGRYVVNESEAAVVGKIFEMYADGKSYSCILEAIKGTSGKQGRPLGKNSIHSILENERYIGVYTWNKRIVKVMRKWAGGKPNPDCVRIENAIPAIISTTLWERVQKRLKSNRRAVNKAKHVYLLTGLIECEKCGSTYVGHCSTNKKGYSTRYYVCGNKYRTHTCSAHNVNADMLEAYVLQELRKYLVSLDIQRAAQDVANAVNSATTSLTAEKKELAEITQKIANGVKAILGGMDIPELKDEVDRLRLRKDELADIIKRKSTNHAPVDAEKVQAVLNAALCSLDDDPAAAIKQMVTKIYAQSDGSIAVELGVHLDGCGGWI